MAQQINKFALVRKNIILGSIVLAVSALIFTASFLYGKTILKSSHKEIRKLNNYVGNITAKISEMQNKSQNSKKYIKIWQELPENKKEFNGLSVNDFNSVLKSLASRYSIQNLKASASTPSKLANNFVGSALQTLASQVDISFDAMSDADALSFIMAIEHNSSGYFKITNLIMKKTRSVDENYILGLSKGSNNPSLSVTVKLIWYGFERRN